MRAEAHDESFAVHGTVAADGGDGLFAVVQLATPLTSVPGAVRLPGLLPDALYDVSVQAPGDTPVLRTSTDAPWLADGVRLSGRVLAASGLRAPALQPQQLLLLRTRKV